MSEEVLKHDEEDSIFLTDGGLDIKWGGVNLAWLIKFLRDRGVRLEDVNIYSSGDPYFGTFIEW